MPILAQPTWGFSARASATAVIEVRRIDGDADRVGGHVGLPRIRHAGESWHPASPQAGRGIRRGDAAISGPFDTA